MEQLEASETAKAAAEFQVKELAKKIPKVQKKVELPKEVAKDYELVKWVGGPRQLFGKFGIIDVTTLTPEKAAILVEKGWRRLRKKE